MKDILECAQTMAEAERKIASMLTDAKAEVVQSIRGQEPYGKVISPNIMVVSFSTISGCGNWSAEHYLPEAQARAVEKVLKRKDTLKSAVSAVKAMLETKTAVSGTEKTYLNPRTLSAIEKSALGMCVKMAY